ncbi:SDR family oxidoreductase [Temperatibacter marinus]|uniref:SDR family oxidoreductase n=1 Tax=Temperatibacter marinus TaxID=1456591 RepID=A0AA52EJZ1_9PROT|nr:SDR family oxidoreductase [Temperatibacter marinus]WND03912.1 SDR family oxidoreductase [Temperatibacter marinus]
MFEDKTIVITGAASGIGKALAKAFAERGSHLALVDLKEEALAALVQSLEGSPGKITSYHADVGDADVVRALPEQILNDHEEINVLINNAGIAIGADFKNTSETQFDRLLQVNLFGVVNMTRAFMPALEKASFAKLVNISSIFGFIAPPNQTAYCASKFAVRGFTESLRHEYRRSHIAISCVHPGGVATNIAKDSLFPDTLKEVEREHLLSLAEKALVAPPAYAAEVIIKGLEKNKPRIFIGKDALMARFFQRLFPLTYMKYIGKRVSL